MTKTASAIRIVKSRTVSRNVRASPCRLARIGGRHNVFLRLADEVGGVADRDFRLQVKENRDARELVQVIHGLRAQRGFPRDQRIERHKSFPVVRPDVQQRKIPGLGALGILTSRIT